MHIGYSGEAAMHCTYSDLVDQCGERVYKLCRKLTFSKEDADDLFQDAFLTAFEQGVCTESRLFSTVLYLWKSRKRKYARRSRIAPAVPLDGSEPIATFVSLEDSIIKQEGRRAVRGLVDALPEKLRIPVILYYTVEMGVADIAAAMGIPEGTVKSRLHNARKTIEKGLVKHGYE